MVFCTPIEIKFLGVWDTVGSVGLARRKTLPFIEYNPGVVHFRQYTGKERSINIHPVGQLHNAIRIHYSAFKQIKDAGCQPEAKWYKLVNEGSLEIEDKPPLSTSSATESDLNITARKSDSLSIRESLKYWARLAFAYLVAFLLVFILWTAIIGVISQVRRLIESETLGALWEMARGVFERIFRLFSEQIYYLDSVSLEVF
ncbi:unnamed protein product [Rhizoctonia solani]|uniref:DUF2235 domain-containing protein n=1 Tax=Rhizoctonia solani TaxID=456999 RepID=A0A8H3H405_9AGAM|nr:unnamed protein product [Rhizoctonia solani]